MNERAPDGSHIWRHPGGKDVVRIRPSNQMVRDVPAARRILEVGCYDGGGRRSGQHLVAVVDRDKEVWIRGHPNAQPQPDVLRVLCRCRTAEHDLDMAKLWQSVELHEHRNRKGRMVDVRSVATAAAI